MTPQAVRAAHPHGDHKRGEVPAPLLEELGRPEDEEQNSRPADPLLPNPITGPEAAGGVVDDTGAATAEDMPTGRPPASISEEEMQAEAMVCRPFSLAEVRRKPLDELAAVEDFEIEAPGLGSLSWPGATDLRPVRNILDKVVVFGPHEVRVYPDGMTKPREGAGLNKRCVYTMQSVWARDKNTGEYLLDPKNVAMFRAQLQRKAERMEARMLDYNSSKGEWRIEVDHF